MSTTSSDNALVALAKQSLANAEKRISKLGEQATSVIGMSGLKTRHLLNNLCSVKGMTYLEVGLWQGSTFFSALYGNELNATGIDNWSEFDGPRKEFVEKTLPRCKGNNTVTVIDGDVFEIPLEAFPKRIDTYFYDGEHSMQSQYSAIARFDPLFAGTFTLVVDDWQQLDVQRGTLFAVNNLGYEVLWEHHCASVGHDAYGWWGGQYLGVLKKREQP